MLLEKDRERDGQREMECYYKKKLVRKKEKKEKRDRDSRDVKEMDYHGITKNKEKERIKVGERDGLQILLLLLKDIKRERWITKRWMDRDGWIIKDNH